MPRVHAGTGVTATSVRSWQRSLCPHRLQSESAREGFCDAVANGEHAEVAMATQPGVVACPPSDDRKRTRLIARRRRRRAELGMELDRERAAAVVAGEVLANREGAVAKLVAHKCSAATDELVHECPRWAHRLGGRR